MENSAEMQRFIQGTVSLVQLALEQQKAMVGEMVGKLTSVCWDKCITSTPGSKFSSSETTCLTNCAQRYLDMSVLIAKRFEMQ
ncbi:hypothetical protein ACP4OV_005388 [Aristida adscensionis]